MTAWDEWKQKQLARLRESLPPKPQAPAPKGKDPVPTRPITDEELERLQILKKITMQTASPDKRFIRDFANTTKDIQITERQAWYIEVLMYKYRRQTGYKGPMPAGYVTRERRGS